MKKHKALEICIENNPFRNKNPYQINLQILPYKPEKEDEKTYWQLELREGTWWYHFRIYYNCYWIADEWWNSDLYHITLIQDTKVEY